MPLEFEPGLAGFTEPTPTNCLLALQAMARLTPEQLTKIQAGLKAMAAQELKEDKSNEPKRR